MSAKAAQALIGSQGTLTVRTSSGGSVLQIRVRCLDVRHAYGRVDALVTPVEGDYEAWVDASRIRWLGQEAEEAMKALA